MCADEIHVFFRIQFWQWNGLRTAYRLGRFSHFIEVPSAAKYHVEMKIDSLNSDRFECDAHIEIPERRRYLHTSKHIQRTEHKV